MSDWRVVGVMTVMVVEVGDGMDGGGGGGDGGDYSYSDSGMDMRYYVYKSYREGRMSDGMMMQ